MTAPYRVLVTGSRNWPDERVVRRELARAWHESGRPIVVVHGACEAGADQHAAQWVRDCAAALLGGVSAERHPADWGRGHSAGLARNRQMVDSRPALCLAFIAPCTRWDCKRPGPHGSHGASHCAAYAEACGITTRRFTP
ncbi:SLOG family protein [Streptomyces sp. NPDC055897]